MKYRSTELLCQTTFPINQLNFSYFAPFFPPFTLQEWVHVLLSPLRTASQLLKATKHNTDCTLHTPAKTEAVPKLHCYVSTKDLVSSCTLFPECPSHNHNNKPHDGKEVVCRNIYTDLTAQEIYAISKHLGLVIQEGRSHSL